MRLSQVVRPGSGQFLSEKGALQYLDEKLSLFEHAVLITGDKSYEAFLKHYPSENTYPVFKYDGTASHEDMKRLSEEIGHQADCVVGVGGGRVLDTAKGVAELLNLEYVMIPTVLGTCAAYTPLSAVYHPDHSFKQVDYYERAAHLCLMDLDLLVESPKKYFLGGIGDTLAKWYEADGITEHLTEKFSAMVEIGLRTAKLTQEILLSDTQEALASMDRCEVTPAFQRVADTVVAVAGTVGGFAGEYGRMAGAHAVHNGMSLVKETHDYEHGVKVAYGVLVQLAAAGKFEDLKQLQNYLRSNGFPTKLKDFGVVENVEESMRAIAEFAASDKETFNLAVPSVNADLVYNAMVMVEHD
ncbi:iron-containing alcohol dehydrogenase family protein [Aerococcaceae bacterium WGS1372]